MGVAGGDALISGERFIEFAQRFEVSRQRHPRGPDKFVFRISFDKTLQSGVGFGEFFLGPLLLGEQQRGRGSSRRAGKFRGNLLQLRRRFRLRERIGSGGLAMLPVKPITGNRRDCEESNDETGDDLRAMAIPKHVGIKHGIEGGIGGGWLGGHEMGRCANDAQRFVLCHAKLRRARASTARGRALTDASPVPLRAHFVHAWGLTALGNGHADLSWVICVLNMRLAYAAR